MSLWRKIVSIHTNSCYRGSQGKGKNSRSFPRIVNPNIPHGPRGNIPSLQDILGKCTLLRLILVVQDKDAEARLLPLAAQLLHCSLDVLFQLADRIFKRCPRIIDLVDDQHVLADQVGHLQRRQVQPLCSRYFCAGLLDVFVGAGAELLVEGEADSLDGDVGAAGGFEEGSWGASVSLILAASLWYPYWLGWVLLVVL